MKRVCVLLIIVLMASALGGCQYAIVEDDPIRVFGIAALAEGSDLFHQSEPDISYLDDLPADLTPPPSGSPSSDSEPTPTPSPKATPTPAATLMPKVKLTPEPRRLPTLTRTPEIGSSEVIPTGEPAAEESEAAGGEAFIGLHSRDEEGENQVRKLQERLNELGYLEAEPDGVFGSRTLKALMRFQRDQGLTETGELDDVTRDALYPEPEVTTAPEDVLYAEGAQGHDIRLIHQMLRTYGFSARALSSQLDEEAADEIAAFQTYMVKYYGTEFDDPITADETAPSVESTAGADGIFEMPALTPEATLRPYHPVDGVISRNLFDYLLSDRFPACRQTLQRGDTGDEVERLQRRLMVLNYYYDAITGEFDELTEAAVKAFQATSDLQPTGIADKETQNVLYNLDALLAEPVEKPFYIMVSTKDQRVYVYRWLNGHYDHLIKSMICSTGVGEDATPKGIYVSPGHRDGQWHYFVDYNCWAQYAFVITGNILFHSVLFSQQDEDTMRMSTLNNLGRKASHGCVRLRVEDARWIYEHCGEGQVIEVY